MGAITEYVNTKKEISNLKNEINNAVKNVNISAHMRSEVIRSTRQKIGVKSRKLRDAENLIVRNYIFPVFFISVLAFLYYFREYLSVF